MVKQFPSPILQKERKQFSPADSLFILHKLQHRCQGAGGGSPCPITPLNLLKRDCHRYHQHHNERLIEKQALAAHGAKGFP